MDAWLQWGLNRQSQHSRGTWGLAWIWRQIHWQSNHFCKRWQFLRGEGPQPTCPHFPHGTTYRAGRDAPSHHSSSSYPGLCLQEPWVTKLWVSEEEVVSGGVIGLFHEETEGMWKKEGWGYLRYKAADGKGGKMSTLCPPTGFPGKKTGIQRGPPTRCHRERHVSMLETAESKSGAHTPQSRNSMHFPLVLTHCYLGLQTSSACKGFCCVSKHYQTNKLILPVSLDVSAICLYALYWPQLANSDGNSSPWMMMDTALFVGAHGNFGAQSPEIPC